MFTTMSMSHRGNELLTSRSNQISAAPTTSVSPATMNWTGVCGGGDVDDASALMSSAVCTGQGGSLSAAPNPGLPDEHQYVLIALYSATTILAVTGNMTVILVLSVGRRSRTDLRAFLINRAVADLTMAAFCMPFTFTTTMRHVWLFGPVMCTIVLFVQVSRQRLPCTYFCTVNSLKLCSLPRKMGSSLRGYHRVDNNRPRAPTASTTEDQEFEGKFDVGDGVFCLRNCTQ